jgi:aspartyl-tRNA(Asn)/glutamyl-tRNA(Gln) amidotransferase subunit C
MQVGKEEILHIAKLAALNIREDEIEEYRKNLQDILNFANIVNSVDTDNVSETIGSTNNVNMFREDEIKEFEDKEALLQNAPEKQNNMFSIPKVI